MTHYKDKKTALKHIIARALTRYASIRAGRQPLPPQRPKTGYKKGRSPGLSFSASHAAMFDAISLFGAFTVVETVNRTHQIAGDTADALKRFVSVIFMPPTAGTLIINDAGVAAAGIPVYRVVDRAVPDTRLFHAADDFFKSIQIF